MSAYRKYNPNDKTSASWPYKGEFAVSRSQADDRNSDPNQGSQADLLPHNGLDGRGLFRTPIGFRETGSNAGGSGSRIQGQARFNGQATGSDRRGGDWKAGRVSSATEEFIAAIEAENRRQSAVLEPIPNSQRKPNYSLAVTYLIGAVILVLMGAGGALVLWGSR